jgi:gliding motility-associated-like protein
MYGQLNVSTTLTPAQLVQNVLVGTGVTVSNITYSGVSGSIGEFTNGNTTNLGLTHGIIISTGVVNGTPSIGSASSNFASTSNLGPSDPDLENITSDINDAAVLQFDFRPISDTLKFRYVFGSEEYPEFVNAGYNDVFGFFITGTNPVGGNYTSYNIARIPNTTVPVSIDNVNAGSYSQYYINNGSGVSIVYDGFTTVLTAWARVVPCQQYHIKIAIGDAGDYIYDSGVFLEANSFSSQGLSYQVSYTSNVDTLAVEGCNNGMVNFVLSQPKTTPTVIHYTVLGTAIEGTDYPVLPDSLIIPAGSISASLVIAPYADGINESTETVKIAYVNTVCGTIDTIRIFINDYNAIQTTTSPDVHSCAGQDANLTVTVAGGYGTINYSWSDNAGNIQNVSVHPPTPTWYYVTVTDGCGIHAIDSVFVSISDLTAIVSNVDSVSCYGYSDGSATLSPSGGISPYSYQWSPNSATTATATGLSAGTYFITVTDNVGCTYTNFVILNNPPAVTFTSTVADETCWNACDGNISTTLGGNFSNPVSYLWSTFPAQTSSTANGLCPGTYTVTVSYSPNHCELIDTAEVLPGELVDAVITTIPSILEGVLPFEVSFDAINSQGAVTYSWDFGDGSPVETTPNPTHIFQNMGTYTVTLNVVGGPPHYCTDNATITVIVLHPSSIFVPNIFTPNGDGKNDQFSIEAEGIASIKISIFNRWGKNIYENEVKDFVVDKQAVPIWDGTSKSEGKCAAGTYYYIIEATGYDKKEYSINGTVNILY